MIVTIATMKLWSCNRMSDSSERSVFGAADSSGGPRLTKGQIRRGTMPVVSLWVFFEKVADQYKRTFQVPLIFFSYLFFSSRPKHRKIVLFTPEHLNCSARVAFCRPFDWMENSQGRRFWSGVICAFAAFHRDRRRPLSTHRPKVHKVAGDPMPSSVFVDHPLLNSVSIE